MINRFWYFIGAIKDFLILLKDPLSAWDKLLIVIAQNDFSLFMLVGGSCLLIVLWVDFLSRFVFIKSRIFFFALKKFLVQCRPS